MKALSIQQPWAWLIVNGYKDIENRNWTTDHRDLLLIHAGKTFDHNFFQNGDLYFPEVWKRLHPELEAIMPRKRDEYEVGGIVGYAWLHKVVTESDSPWFHGPYGFVLTVRRPVDLIALRGQLGLFEVPAEIDAQIDEIREQRWVEAEAKDFNQIKREWYEYAHEGDETPPYAYHRGFPADID